MLNYTKRDIYAYAFWISLFILIILMIFDIRKFGEKPKYDLQDNLKVENLYARVTKKIYPKEIQSVSNSSAQKKRTEQMISSINIYSTNPWRIKIPSLRIDAPIAEGTSDEALRRTVGHIENTSLWQGNVGLAGHNRGYRCNFFAEIKKLKKGDEILYCTEKGEKKYQVILNKLINETDWSYLKKTKDNRITLITCENNKRTYRRCIQAIEVQNT